MPHAAGPIASYDRGKDRAEEEQAPAPFRQPGSGQKGLPCQRVCRIKLFFAGFSSELRIFAICDRLDEKARQRPGKPLPKSATRKIRRLPFRQAAMQKPSLEARKRTGTKITRTWPPCSFLSHAGRTFFQEARATALPCGKPLRQEKKGNRLFSFHCYASSCHRFAKPCRLNRNPTPWSR